MSDLNIDLKKFAENAKKMKKVKDDFSLCFNAEAHELEKSIKTLFGENEQTYVYNELVKLDINLISFPKVGRLQTIFQYIDQPFLKKYQDNFLSKYDVKVSPEQPKRPEVGSEKSVIEEFNTQIKKWQEENKSVKEWNTKFNTIKEYLESIITVDLYGDTTLDVTKLPYIYFTFFNTDIDEIEVFMQELRTCPAPPVKKIKAISIEDISGKLPDFLKSANEVRVYFDTDAEAEELHGSKDYVEGVYEKYVIKNDTMKKSGGEWGMYNKRKDNLDNPVIGGFNLQTVPTPINLNSGNSVDEEAEFYKKDYEVDITDCYYAKTIINDEEVFAIVPKDFWDEYSTVLVNPTMTILGITDNKSWRKDDIYFKSYDTIENATEYLEENSEYSEELSEYLTEQENLSPFKKALKKLLNAKNFDKDWEMYTDVYELSRVKNFPTCQNLYDKLSLKDKQELWGFHGFKNESDFLKEIYLDEEQDFENFEVYNLTDTLLTIMCGGDWQQPAIITFKLVNDEIEVVDYYYDVDGTSIPTSTFDEEEEDDCDEEISEDEIRECNPEECYWVIDYMDDDGDFYLSITPKDDWNTYHTIYENDLKFTNKIVKGYELEGTFEDGYSLLDKNGNSVKTLLLIAKVMKDSGFEFSTEIQEELNTESLNGKRVQYLNETETEYFNKATIEFAEYLYNLDSTHTEIIFNNETETLLDIVQKNINDEKKIIDILSSLTKKLDSEKKDKDGKTALAIAAEENLTKIVTILVKNGADVNAKDKDNGVPLFWAAYKGNLEVVKLLLDNGANIDVQDNNGDTALLFATMYNQYDTVVELISRGADLTLKNNKKHTALDCANLCRFFDIAELLRGDVDIEDVDFGDDGDDEESESNTGEDFVWSIAINPDFGGIDFGDGDNPVMLAITPKKYWEKYKYLSDESGLKVNEILVNGYELDEDMESCFSLRYANSFTYVTKISEIKLVLDKSGFEYSWDMQKNLDGNHAIVNSNNYTDKNSFFAALKAKLGQ